MVWVTKELDILTQKIEIIPGSISDHNPVSWQLKNNNEEVKRWIINEDILDKMEIMEHVRKDIKDYFDCNLTSDVNLSIVWDAFKAVVRGRLINWNLIEKNKTKRNRCRFKMK